MRVLQVANGFPPQAFAGVELHTLQLCRALQGRHTLAVFCREADLRRPEFAMRADTYADLEVWRVNNNFLDVLDFAGFYRQPEIDAHFRAVVARWQPDLIHFQHCIGLSAELPRLAHELGVPSLLTLHDYWYLCPTVQLLDTRPALCPGSHHAVNCFACVRLGDPRLARLRRSWMYPLAVRLPAPVKAAIAEAVELGLGRRRAAAPAAAAAVPAPTLAQQTAMAERVAAMRQTLSYPDALTAPSQFVQTLYVEFGIPAERITVMPLGMEVERWRALRGTTAPQPGAGVRFTYIGGLLPHKGVAVALEAFRALPGADHRLALHGFMAPEDHRFNRELRRRIAADPRVTWHGPYRHEADLPGILSRTDVLLVPSLWHETFSFVAREALLAGKWVIGADAGALRELIRPGHNGWLAPPGDVDAWAAALRTAAASDRLALAPAETFAPWTFEDYAAAVDARYQAIRAARAGRG